MPIPQEFEPCTILALPRYYCHHRATSKTASVNSAFATSPPMNWYYMLGGETCFIGTASCIIHALFEGGISIYVEILSSYLFQLPPKFRISALLLPSRPPIAK